MNATAAIKAILEADATLEGMIQFLPGDTRTDYIYTKPLTRLLSPTAFQKPTVDTLWPSLYIASAAPVRHPQDYKIPYMTVIYPHVWCYVPTLEGIEYEEKARLILQRVRVLIHDIQVIDPDTGLSGRLAWFGDTAGREADEYTKVWAESSMYEYRARWRDE